MANMDMIILGTLLSGPQHGYQLKQNIEASYGKRYISIGNSTLYPRLARLEAEGCIEGRREEQDKIPDRKVYTITPAGMNRLHDLAATPLKPGDHPFDVGLHAVLFRLLTSGERKGVIEPLYRDALLELEENLQKRQHFGPMLDQYMTAVLDSGIRDIRNKIELYKKLIEMG
jgi:DNA-binding PadR family transcriptional regulator